MLDSQKNRVNNGSTGVEKSNHDWEHYIFNAQKSSRNLFKQPDGIPSKAAVEKSEFQPTLEKEMSDPPRSLPEELESSCLPLESQTLMDFC